MLQPMDPTSFELLLPSGERVPLTGIVTIGRAPGNVVQLDDRTVSRHHATILVHEGGPSVDDAGSSHGTWVNGSRLTRPRVVGDGDGIRVGDSELVVERRRTEAEAGRTVLVPLASETSASGRFGTQPRLRSGYALKRLDSSEGLRRWVLKDLREGAFVRFSDADAALVQLIDGRRSLADLARDAEERAGPDGPMHLAGVLSELSDRGLLSGAAGSGGEPPETYGWRRLFTPRQRSWDGAGDFFQALY